jgi:WD40 repeat protein
VNSVSALAFSPDGTIVAAASRDGHIHFWNTESGERIGELEESSPSIEAIAFWKNDMLASAGYDKSISIWDLTNWRNKRILKGHLGAIHTLAFLDEFTVLAGGVETKGQEHSTGELRMWDIRTGVCTHSTSFEEGVIRSMALAPGTSNVHVGCSDGSLIQWDYKNYSISRIKHVSDGIVCCLDITKDGKLLATAGLRGPTEGIVRIWKVSCIADH